MCANGFPPQILKTQAFTVAKLVPIASNLWRGSDWENKFAFHLGSVLNMLDMDPRYMVHGTCMIHGT